MLRTTLFALLSTLPVASAQEADARDDRPNILVLIGDDHAANALGCADHPFVKTPALDELAAAGVRFTQAFATTSLCSPSSNAGSTCTVNPCSSCWTGSNRAGAGPAAAQSR